MKLKLFFLPLIFLSIISFHANGQITNMLNNGDFEAGQDAWSGWGTGIVISENNPYEGNNCAQFTVRNSIDQSPINLEAGKTYKLSAWIRINSMSGNDWGGIRFSAIEYNWSTWYNSDFLTSQNRPVGEWFNEIVTFVPVSNQIRIQIGFFGGSGWTADYSYDDVMLFEEPVVNVPPEISAVNISPLSGNVPLPVNGEIVASDVDGTIENYIIDMGDGAVYYNTSVFSHTYRIPGNYTINITVIDDSGDEDTASVQIAAAGSGNHQIQITSPQPGGGSQYLTTSDSVFLLGTRQNGTGDVFWINNRTMQSGYTTVVNDQFLIPYISLDIGWNKILVQSSQGNGTYVLDEINVNYVPVEYSGPQISSVQTTKNVVKQYERTDVFFNVQTVAQNLFFPFDEDMPPNLNTGHGISVDMEFTNGPQVLIQPAFLHMETTRMNDQLVPDGQFRWNVRMAFKNTGTWTSRIIARDVEGETILTGPTFTVVADSINPGFISVSENDDRYFEYDNGQPFFAMGHGTGVSNPDETDQEISDWSQNGLNFGRFWLSSNAPFSDSWSSWATHHPMQNNGYMPPPLLTSQQKYGNGQFSWRIASPAIENQNTPAIFRGFWDGPIPAMPSTTYRIIARVKTVDIQGTGGLVIKTGGWLGTDVINPGTGTALSGYLRGDNNWMYLVGTLTTGASQNNFEYIYLVLENCNGEAYVDQMTIQEVNPGGDLEQNILSKWNANTHHYLDPIKSREADYKIEKANSKGIHYKIVVHEKNDFICNQIDENGYVSPSNGSFDQPENSPLRRLYEYYWRHLIARWGYATAVHSWELVNEGAPGSYMDLTNGLAGYINTNSPFPKMVSTSFWSNWEPAYWASSDADYADIHAYIMTTGWIDNITIDGQLYDREALKNDAAAAVYAYSITVGEDAQRNKPVILGETDLDMTGSQEPDPMLALDTEGIWLHNFNWAHINHGGMQSLIWNSDNIRNNDLYYRYRGFHHFIKDIPLTTGQYQQLNANSTNSQLRVWGQIQNSGNAAHFWVQNRDHTWRNVLENGTPAPQTGLIAVSGLTPGPMVIQTWNSWNEDTTAIQSDTIVINNSGTYQLQITDLATDLAFKFFNEEAGAQISIAYDWPQFQRDAARTGRTTLSIPPPYRARWIWCNPGLTLRNQQSETGWPDDLTSRNGYSFPIPATSAQTISGAVQAIVKGERLYFGTMEGKAYALQLNNGATQWEANIAGGTVVSAAVLENLVVFGGIKGTIYAFDTLSGVLQWQYHSGGAITAAPCVIGNSVVIANHRGKVIRINSSGTKIWDQKLNFPVTGGIAAYGMLVYVPAEDMKVYAINLLNGTIEAEQQVRGQSFRQCHPVYFNGKLWVTSCPTPIAGSEYIMDDVLASGNDQQQEESNIREWLEGNDNGGQWNYASPDWQNIFALDGQNLGNMFLIGSGPVDGCGTPPPSVVVDNQNRVLRWFKTRYPYLTGAGPAFGTPYTVDISGIDQENGNRIPVDNGHLSGMWLLETDNIYGLSVGGEYLWMRQNFRGTQVINLNTSVWEMVQADIRFNDGGNFSGSHICYLDQVQNNHYLGTPFILPQQPFMYRTPPAIAGNYVIIVEDFGIVAIENY